MSHPTIAVIGAGNMGTALIAGLLNTNHPPDTIWACDTSQEKLEALREQYPIHITQDNAEAVAKADIILFAIKPQIFSQVAKALAPILKNHALVISIAAGVTVPHISEWIGKNLPIVRAMPNTPALINCGATALFANSQVSKEQHECAESIFRAVGITVWLEEEHLLDVVTALSGSGPAYFFLVMEVLQLAAQELGLKSDVARLLTIQTALGAARLALQSSHSLEHLRHQVTSPGGTTERALNVLQSEHVPEVFRKALQAAKLRAEELAGG